MDAPYVVLGDFGLAKMLKDDEEYLQDEAPEGTYYYLSPEVRFLTSFLYLRFEIPKLLLCSSIVHVGHIQTLMYQSIPIVTIPRPTPGKISKKKQNRQIPAPRANFLCQIPGDLASLGPSGLINFTLFHRIPQSLIYPLNIYKFVGRT